jgi:acyl-CoA dehydrogenase
LPKDGGRALQAFFAEVSGYIKERDTDAAMTPYVGPLTRALGELRDATAWLAQNAPGNPDNAGAGAADYMQLFGLVALGYMWCLIADAAKARAAEGYGDAARMNDKFVIGRFFMERMLPATTAHLMRIKAGAASTMMLPAEAF